ncbi:MAG: AraC family transcriptional regulator [Ruminococcaceae bacterium]|nr:AraC family transcriptional regulator [Oscillospiraceae bacterium]
MKLFSHYIENQPKQGFEIRNWQDRLVGEYFCYSYRDTLYDRSTFPCRLHSHDYYELVVFEEGEVHYLCDGNVFYPTRADMMIVPPGKIHVTVPDSEKTNYKRHVFYFYPSAFDFIRSACLLSFVSDINEGKLLSFQDQGLKEELCGLLEDLKALSNKNNGVFDGALCLSYVIQAFCLLNNKSCKPNEETAHLPENLLNIQRYIDTNISRITSVSDIASHFFYSREYVSRLFKKHFDTTIADYITKRRVAESRVLILQGMPMIEVAYGVGFGSLSTFIRAFRAETNMTPSEYRKLRRANEITK